MRLDIYQAETARIAAEQAALLQQGGVLHALQLLIENAIGKAKQILKSGNEPVPVSAYDAFALLARLGVIGQADLGSWNSIIGLRNRIVHD